MYARDHHLAEHKLNQAIEDVTSRIRTRFPDAAFDVLHGDDPAGTYIWTRVDIDDPDAVLDFIAGMLLELQVDEGLPLHVVPYRPAAALSQ